MIHTYEQALSLLWKEVDALPDMVLATSQEGRVTARRVNIARVGGRLCFMTTRGSTKWRQIHHNPQVALCQGNVLFTGTARFHGPPDQEQDAAVLAALRRSFGPWYSHYVQPESLVGVILPHEAAFYYEEGDATVTCRLDFLQHTFTEETDAPETEGTHGL